MHAKHLLLLLSLTALIVAGSDSAHAEEVDVEEHEPAWDLEIGGYGELEFSWLDYAADGTRPGGARDDSRLVFDQTRFALELDGELPADIELEAEIEFEHGGTGAALELEYEEFGEYDTEIEKGGEVSVEELYLEKSFFDEHAWVKLGRFYLAFGLLRDLPRPGDYLGVSRPESETRVIPGVWDEMGAELGLRQGPVTVTAQVVNGLDSTGFSSQYWVTGGHQQRFEQIIGSGLAGVARIDVEPVDDLVIGGSAYYGGTTRNRPKPDMTRDCGDSGRDDVVAPCGYIEAPLGLVDGHARWDGRWLRARAVLIWGALQNAGAISERNRSLSNNLGVLRSDVAEQALATWLELGVNTLAWSGLEQHVLEVWGRGEYYDTMFASRASLVDVPRFERRVVSAGVDYTYADAVVMKLGWSHRWFGAADLNHENTLSLSAGFQF